MGPLRHGTVCHVTGTAANQAAAGHVSLVDCGCRQSSDLTGVSEYRCVLHGRLYSGVQDEMAMASTQATPGVLPLMGLEPFDSATDSWTQWEERLLYYIDYYDVITDVTIRRLE